jgi:pyrroloquinoline-quinone synthase
MATRLAAWAKHYPWVDAGVQEYFRSRVTRARSDALEAIDFVAAHATSRELQDRCVDAFVTKCNVLWSLLDAVAMAYPS